MHRLKHNHSVPLFYHKAQVKERGMALKKAAKIKSEIVAEPTAVIYARFSSHNQTEQSIEGQLRVCYEYAERSGYKVVGEYIDRALTGRSDDRPDFQRMVFDAKKKAFQYVIVYKLDRFARNRYDSSIYKHKLKQNGVKVLSAMENIGDNPESIILEAVLEASAEYYSVDLSQKIKRGSRESAMKGQFLGGQVPFGYKVIDHHLVIDEVKAPIIQYLFTEYAKGVPKKDIIENINAAGFRNNNGKLFYNTSFQTALLCEKYMGVMRWNDITSECPAIVDKETFEKVQQRIALNKRAAGAQKADVNYQLSGKMFCGYCGSTMIGISGTSKTGDKHYYYACRGRRLRNGCKKKHEKKDFIEWYVCEQTVKYVLSPSRMQEIASSVVAQYDNEFNDGKIRELERAIAKHDRDIDKFTDMLLEVPKAARQKIYDKIELADMQKNDLEIDLSKLRIANSIRYTEEDIIAWLKTFCNGDLCDTAFRQRIIDVFVNSIYLYDDRVIVFYNIHGGKQVSYIDMLNAAESEFDDFPDIADLSGSDDNSNPAEKVRILNGMLHQIVLNPNFFLIGNEFGFIVLLSQWKLF